MASATRRSAGGQLPKHSSLSPSKPLVPSLLPLTAIAAEVTSPAVDAVSHCRKELRLQATTTSRWCEVETETQVGSGPRAGRDGVLTPTEDDGSTSCCRRRRGVAGGTVVEAWSGGVAGREGGRQQLEESGRGTRGRVHDVLRPVKTGEGSAIERSKSRAEQIQRFAD